MIPYAIVFPIGIGICYYTPLMCGWEHLPSKKGMVSGLIIGGFGFGAFIFGFISTAIANPDNLKKVKEDPTCTGDDCNSFFPSEVYDKVPRMIRICSLLWIPLALTGILFVTRNDDYVKKAKIEGRNEIIDKIE